VNRRSALIAALGAGLGTGIAAGCTSPAPPPRTRSPQQNPTPSPAPSQSPPAEIAHGDRNRPTVALTFHGQGDAPGANRLLDVLHAADVRVTVLAVGTWLQEQPAIATRILDAGHELGNHTQHHLDLKAMSPDQVYAEISLCAQQLKRVGGSIGQWFRPSQTQYSTPLIEAQAQRAGYATCLSYDVDSLDYTDPGAAAIVRTTMQTVRNGSIVSLHFGHSGTVEALPELLDQLHTRGLRAVTVTELVG
jgi:peptidoglycan/xylan/chitin deacetylase (PgdA/CDA1 family)